MMLPFFQWMQDLEISGVMRNSPWIGPGVNILHLLALTMFAGALLMVDLRLLGTGLTRQPLAPLARAAQPWLIGYRRPLFWLESWMYLDIDTARRGAVQA